MGSTSSSTTRAYSRGGPLSDLFLDDIAAVAYLAGEGGRNVTDTTLLVDAGASA